MVIRGKSSLPSVLENQVIDSSLASVGCGGTKFYFDCCHRYKFMAKLSSFQKLNDIEPPGRIRVGFIGRD